MAEMKNRKPEEDPPKKQVPVWAHALNGTLLDAMEEPVHVVDGDLRFLLTNRAFREWAGALGLETDVIGRKLFDVYPFLPEKVREEYLLVFRTGEEVVTEEYTTVGDREHCTRTRKIPVEEGGAVTMVVTVLRDISAERIFEDELEASQERYRALVESTEDSIYLLDRKYRYLFMNERHRARMGLGAADYRDRHYGDFHAADATERFVALAEKVFETGESLQNEYRSKRDGSWFLQTLSPVRSRERGIVAVTVVSKNITGRKAMEDELRTLSLTDELTGLYNRRGFYTLVEHQLKMARRMRRGIYLLYVDVDDMKEVNDRHGHVAGDQLLMETASVVKRNFRDSDIVARIGGDEFVVVPVEGPWKHAEMLIARLHAAVARSNEEGKVDYPLALSVGAAYYDPEHPLSIDALLAEADQSMYEDKRKKQSPGS
jgi:diguanylate cyclase (GGDEF)-like protein/PAS domain S-box-containing protein